MSRMAGAGVLSILLLAAPTRGDWTLDPALKLESEWALETASGATQKFEVLIFPEAEASLPLDVELTFVGRARIDAVDELEPGSPKPTEVSVLSRRGPAGDLVDFDLRELVLERDFGPFYLTAGKQHIVWGKADGLKVLDVVNPQDFREFILDDFENSRITLWTLNLEAEVGWTTLQVVWIPDPSYHEIPTPGSRYELTSPLVVPPAPPPESPVVVKPARKPNRLIEDSDAGVHLSTFQGGWDFTLNYLYHYDDSPIAFRRLPGTPGEPLIVEPGYRRTHLVGGTFANAVGDVTFRGEAGISFDRFFFNLDPRDPDGVSKDDVISYVLGFDWYGIRETFVSVQLFQSTLLDDVRHLTRDRHEWNGTFTVRRDFWNDTLLAELIWIVGWNRLDGLLRPKLSYAVRDNLTLWVGNDLFHGPRRGLFGQFDERDRLVLGFEVTR